MKLANVFVATTMLAACALDPDPRATYFGGESEGDDATGTSGNGTGGPIGDGSVVTIQDIQQGRVPEGTTVRVEGVVVTTPVNREEGAVFVEDPAGGPYSGIYLFMFDEVAQGVSLAPGDVVDLVGEYTEYYDFSELTIRTPTDLVVTGQGPVPAPEIVTAQQLAATSPDAEQYESVLVRIEGATVSNPDLGFGDWEVDGAAVITNFFLFDVMAPEYPVADSVYESITGPVLYNFGAYKVAPRTPEDLVGGVDQPEGPVTIYEIQGGMVPPGAPVVVENVVVTTPVAEDTFWVQDPQGGEYSGIAVFVADPGQGIQVQPGSVVTLTGQYTEFYDQSQIAMPDVQGLSIQGTDEVPMPQVVMPGDIGSGQGAEPWEGVLVRVQDVVVSAPPNMFGDFEVGQALLVTNIFLPAASWPMPAVDDAFASITGVLAYSFDEYRLAPRTASDLLTP